MAGVSRRDPVQGMSPDPLNIPIAITFFANAAASEKREAELSMRELAAKVIVTTAASKAQLPWLKLATFGEQRTLKGSLRSNSNMVFITGVEADYDGGVVSTDQARELLAAAGVASLVYTSPSHTPAAPRWRVLCPLSEWLPVASRKGLAARLNGALGGIVAAESFTDSQAYYLGAVGQNPAHDAWLVPGVCLDTLPDLPEVFPKPPKPLALPPIPAGTPPAGRLAAACALFDGTAPRHQVLLTATNLIAPLILSGHVAEGDAAAELARAMANSGREPNDGEVESAMRDALARGKPFVDGSEFDDIPAPAPAARVGRHRLVFPVNCAIGPGRGYLVKHLLAPGDVAALVGQPSSGKSMLAPYIAYAVAQGRSVFGLRTKPGRVLYVAAEDFTGMRQRIHALLLHHGPTGDFALTACGSLLDSGEAADLRAAVADVKPSLVVIDTLGAAWAGIEENSSQDMGQVVALTRQIAGTGAAVLLVHHIAKQGDGTPRGHSALNGTLDMVLRLEAKDDAGVIRGVLGKNRNGTDQTRIAFRVAVADLGEDEDGDRITAPMAEELPECKTACKPFQIPGVNSVQ